MSPSPIAQRWLAPAKINLFLHVVGRRANGYHELQTVFQLLDYCDEITVSLREDNHIQLTVECDPTLLNHDLGPTRDNLILRAAQLLQQTSQQAQGATIHLTKHIPIGGGLGGGSSNAATTLLALNQLWQLQLPLTTLAQLGVQLGADVPVFIHGHSAWAEGIGDKLQTITLEPRWFVVVVPTCSVATAEIYSATELTRDTSPITIQQFLSGSCLTRNDCEPVVQSRYPIIAEALKWLGQFAPARLTGSGGCIFAALPDEQHAREIAQQIPPPLCGFVAKGINNSPLLDSVAALSANANCNENCC